MYSRATRVNDQYFQNLVKTERRKAVQDKARYCRQGFPSQGGLYSRRGKGGSGDKPKPRPQPIDPGKKLQIYDSNVPMANRLQAKADNFASVLRFIRKHRHLGYILMLGREEHRPWK
jgi:hypothetical protein